MSATLDHLTQLEAVQDYLDVLTGEQFVVLYCREVHGWSFRQIGNFLGITPQAASYRLSSAGQRLLTAYPHLADRVQGRRMRPYVRRQVDHTDRTRQVLDAIRQIYRAGEDGLPAAELSRRLDIDRRTMGKIVHALIAQGHLRRGRRQGRRGYPLYLVASEAKQSPPDEEAK